MLSHKTVYCPQREKRNSVKCVNNQLCTFCGGGVGFTCSVKYDAVHWVHSVSHSGSGRDWCPCRQISEWGRFCYRSPHLGDMTCNSKEFCSRSYKYVRKYVDRITGVISIYVIGHVLFHNVLNYWKLTLIDIINVCKNYKNFFKHLGEQFSMNIKIFVKRWGGGWGGGGGGVGAG